MAGKKTQKEIIEELTNGMNESIKSYQTDRKEEQKLLDFMNRFNKYSIRNIALIQRQFGTSAVGVASYKQHKANGYQVQKGEKAIRILAPRFQKMFQNNKKEWKFLSQASAQEKKQIKAGTFKVEERLAGYLSVPVFDITQTDCPEQDYPRLYPNRPENFTFDGSEEDVKKLKSVLIDFADEKNIGVSFGKTDSTAKGYFQPDSNSIVVKDTLSETEQISVLLHELAHANMHNYATMANKTNDQKLTNVLEYQAEMTAYVVCSTLGIDSKEHSQKYLASWTKRDVDNDVYIKSLEEVKNVSSSFINEVSNRFEKLEKNLILDEPEYKSLIDFQLSYYEKVEINDKGKIEFTKDIEQNLPKEVYDTYKDLWKDNFRESLLDNLNSFSFEELQKDEFLSKSPKLLDKLPLIDDSLKEELNLLKKENQHAKELDLDNDGVPDRIDADDTRSVIRTEADKSLVGNRTDKHEQEQKNTKSRSRIR